MKLSDKFSLESGVVYLTGIQALVRLPLDQMRRDRRAGLNTGAFISGYEGSPLGGYDLALGRVQGLLKQHNIHFQPGVNEDLAATSILGTQVLETLGPARADGVLGIWYGKGPGVDRSGDIFRHANLAGTGRNSAALVLAGDDHSCKSSTIPHQSDFSLMNAGMPFFYPGNVQEVLDYGLLAVALSRYSGAWVGMKMVTDVCDGGGTVRVQPGEPRISLPEGYVKHTDARVVAPVSLALEAEVNTRRLEAARQFARANAVNRFYGAASNAWLGIATAGKSYYDLAQALRDLGISESGLQTLGVRVAKFGITFPLDAAFAREFAIGLEAILVIEEKRSFLELHLKDALYSLTARPIVVGKQDETGVPLFPPTGELDPDRIARVVGELVARRHPVESVLARLDQLAEIAGRSKELIALRAPNFCSGCPHNRSTLLLDGQVAGGGIGCHTMAMRLTGSNRSFSFLTHMGGEGAPWIGMAPFAARKHIFQNIGDGTYFHSGSLAVRASVAAGVNVTYKILYNGHVSMTGGQEIVGGLPVPALTRQLEAEGVRKTVILAENTGQYEGAALARNAQVRDRSELSKTLAELEKVPGVTALIYDQECAAEKRRKRSRGKLEEPTERLMIHEEVCEGCGDCVKESNCMSLNPVATEFGQKMRIHQSSCNKDYTCALGDCPSFITVRIRKGSGLRKPQVPQLPPAEVPPPSQVREIAANGYRILLPGIGGTGVVTINALLATAAWIDGLHVVTLDQTGSAQKGGAVVSHLLLSRTPLDAPARINAANADLILGFDLVGLSNPENLKLAVPERTVAVVNTALVPTVDSIRSRTVLAGPERMLERVNQVTRSGYNLFADANRLAEALFGTHLASNIFLLGIAWQAGLVPVSLKGLEQAIELNEVETGRNRQAFLWGRKYYEDAEWVESCLNPAVSEPSPGDPVELRVAELTAYQNEAYARSYREFVDQVARRAPELRETVARNLYKLMSYKDEYEVARLLTKPDFERRIRDTWEHVEGVSYNLHPPLLRRFGVKSKLKLGPFWRFPLRFLASFKRLRGTPADVFGWSRHRRMERDLIVWYQDLIRNLLERRDLDPTTALEIAALPDRIRGYEVVKEASVREVKEAARDKLAAVEAAARAHSAR